MKKPILSSQEGQETPLLSSSLPPLPPARDTLPDDAMSKKQARERRDALVRGVTSIHEMREAIRRSARDKPTPTTLKCFGLMNAATFRLHAAEGLPFVMTGLVCKWPLSGHTEQSMRDRYGNLPVRARMGDYINTAFAPDRAMKDMSLLTYLDLVAETTDELPPYVGNLELRELNTLCHWPSYFKKIGPPRFWLGPAGTVTPLHCDYDDNIFAQIWGSKRIFLSPPHHDEFLYPREANAMLFGSPFNPEAPDFDKFPLARKAAMIEYIIQPGELLYVPAGWYHQVRSLTFSLSANRWARALPLALNGNAQLKVGSIDTNQELPSAAGGLAT
jgi:hypothetical protein